MIDATEFLKGQQDCAKGIPHKEGMTDSYDRGFNAQYELEQVQGALCQQSPSN